jgi:hypothetical protein
MEYATDSQLTISLTPRNELVVWPTTQDFTEAGKDRTATWGRFVSIMQNGEPNYWHTKEHEMAIQASTDTSMLAEWAETLLVLVEHKLVAGSEFSIGAPTPMGMLMLDMANEFDRVKADLEDDIDWVRRDLEGAIDDVQDSVRNLESK